MLKVNLVIIVTWTEYFLCQHDVELCMPNLDRTKLSIYVEEWAARNLIRFLSPPQTQTCGIKL